MKINSFEGASLMDMFHGLPEAENFGPGAEVDLVFTSGDLDRGASLCDLKVSLSRDDNINLKTLVATPSFRLQHGRDYYYRG